MLYILISFFASAAGAISGIGGGILIKPILDLASSLGAAQINFLSSCTVFSMTAMTLFRRRSSLRESVDMQLCCLAIGSVLGGIWGSSLFGAARKSLAPGDVRIIQSAILIGLCVVIIAYMLRKERFKTYQMKSRAVSVLAGLALGVISAFLGIGGGPFNLVVLALLFSMDSRRATLSSIFIIFCAQTAGLVFTAAEGIPNVPLSALAAMIAGGISGGLLGGSLGKKASAKQTDIMFTCVTCLVIIASAVNIFGALASRA